MGASSPSDYGDYYAWGELYPKYNYTWDSYKYYNKKEGFTKYNETDGLDILEPEDDAAHVQWGGNWQIPSWADWDELLDHVNIYTVNQSGITYYSLESKHNSGKLIIPLNGFKTDNSEVKSRGEASCIWLCTNTLAPIKAKEENAYALISKPNQSHKFNDMPQEAARCCGLAIRPVYCKHGKLSRAQIEANVQKERDARLKEEQEIRENQVVLSVLTDYPPLFQGNKKYGDSIKAFYNYMRDKIGRKKEYALSGFVYIGKDGRIYDVSIVKVFKGPENIESLFKKAAFSCPAWTPAREPRKGEFAVKSEVPFRLSNP